MTIILLASCAEKHLITNKEYLEHTDRAFILKKQLAINRDSALFSVFKQALTTEQSEALKFLYAYMPLSDLADYNGDFFLANADIALKARKESKWGTEIPEDVFLHYVLPYRVNNENLDSFRIAYHNEIMNRVKGMDLADAAMEINHWCHEKVAYQAADSRTSAPMSTILSARGRCGEESTFTVAALRAAGIPARQVYTPRWAHTDDNHAWVEIWNDGEWFYMGACEPEPVLDRGWFTEPARRAMLVHTKSFGAFYGDESAIIKNKNYTYINNLRKYAVTRNVSVKVTDKDNAPVSGAIVEFQLYNYAEFYPLAAIATNDSGLCQFETGLGDLLIWAHKNDSFDFRKITVAETDTLVLKLNREVTPDSSFDLDLNVPPVNAPINGPSAELVALNASRVENENAIRQGYIDTWMKPSKAVKLANSVNADTAQIKNIIARSMGNYREISSFLAETGDSLLPLAISLLEILPDKDLRDVKKNILSDHLINSKISLDNESSTGNKMAIEFILNPRVANEMLVAYRRYFLTRLPEELIMNAKNDPSLAVEYLNKRIAIADDENYYQTPLTPIGVNELRVADRPSRSICLVAILRSLGIPSRLEPGRNIPQYFNDNRWVDVYFSDQKPPDQNKGFLKLTSYDTKPVPEYYIHFTLARFENGRYNTLEYDWNRKVTDFKEELLLPPGKYMLVTGNRLNDSKILSNISFFELAAGEHKQLEIAIRKDAGERKTLGQIDIEKFSDLTGIPTLSQSCKRDNGLVIIWIEPEKEPTKHIFNDLPLLKSELDAWGGKFLFLSDSPFNGSGLKGLPANTTFAADKDLDFLKKHVRFNAPPEISSPAVIVSDGDGNIVFSSMGYRIGIGEQILKALN